MMASPRAPAERVVVVMALCPVADGHFHDFWVPRSGMSG
jgi:hypothetical protein